MKWKQRNEQTINLTTVHTTVLNYCYFSSNFDVCMRRDGEWWTSNFFYRIVYVLFSGVILTYSLMIFNILTQLPRILCIWAHSVRMSFVDERVFWFSATTTISIVHLFPFSLCNRLLYWYWFVCVCFFCFFFSFLAVPWWAFQFISMRFLQQKIQTRVFVSISLCTLIQL